MPLKNYTTKRQRTFERIQKTLVSHGATDIMFQYNTEGKIKALAFAIDSPQGKLKVRLPARVEKVAKVLEFQQVDPRYQEPDHVYNVAWAILDDWVSAQMALLETEMVKMEEIFLPYVEMRDGRTLFENMIDTNFQLKSGNGAQEGEVIIANE